MTVYSNELNLVYTASSAESLPLFDAALTSYLGARTDVMEILDGLRGTDPDMFMGQVFRGYLLKLAGHPQFVAPLADLINSLEAQASALSVTSREQTHLKVLQLWIEDQSAAALSLLEQLLLQHPLDMLALRIAHYLHFYEGSGAAMSASTERVLNAWPKDHPHFPYLQGMHAFGLEECGDYDQALALGQDAVQANSQDIWATHAVAHVYEMLGEYEQGNNWLTETEPGWRDTNNFRYHVIWHQALFSLGLGDHDRALAIYDQQLADSINDDFYLDVCNNAALLWRLEFLGVDVGQRWQPLVDICAAHIKDRELLFANLHYLIPLAVTSAPALEPALENFSDWAQGSTGQAVLCREVGLQLAQAVAQAPQQPGAALDCLLAVKDETYRIGGSKAQRDLFRLLGRHAAKQSHREELLSQLS
ncbi:MAG: tetratricopeptide repeat protein [Pseudomonadaceae bacterium]|nr:tetratricopeptide repeat protein [Pseudomonadaceae bacterium]